MAKRSTYAALLALVCLSLIVRYPRVPHGVGVDSYLFAVLASSIVNQQHAAWIVNPLSAFGLYPLSYPSGSFFLTADFSMTSGVPVELATLLLSEFVGVLGVFIGFVMARDFSRSDKVALSVGLMFSLMPKFVTNTLWEVPARGLLMAMTPMFLWAVLRAIRTHRRVDTAMVAVAFLLMALSHRLAVVVLIVFFAFLAALIFVLAAQIVRRQLPRLFMSLSFRRRSRALGLVVYGGAIAILLFGSGVLEAYQQGAYFSDDVPFGSVGNLVVSLTRSIGFLSPVSVLGVAIIVRSRNKTPSEYLFLTAPMALIPTLFLRDYTGYYLVAFFALFIGIGCVNFMTRLPRRIQPVGASVLAALVLFSASFAISLELPRQTYMTVTEYSAGLYAKYNVADGLASNSGVLGARVGSVSGGPFLPIGGATTAQYGPDAMAFGFVTEFSVTPVPIWDLTIDSDSIYQPVDITVGADWSILFASPLSSRSSQIADRYHITTILEDRNSLGTYHTGWGVDYESLLLRDVYASRYKIYETDEVRMWQLF